MTDANLRLHGVRAVDEIDAARFDGRRSDRRTRRLRAPLPSGEERCDEVDDPTCLHVTGDDHAGVVRNEVRSVEAPHVVHGDAHDRLRSSDDRVAVRAGAVEQIGEALGSDGRRFIALLQKLIQALAADALQGRSGKHRPLGHVGEDLHRRLRIAAQHVDRDVGCVPICAGGQGAAEESDVFGQANGVAGAGAFIEQLGGDRRQPGQLRCVVIRARSNQCARGDQRRIVALRHQNPQSVLQRLPPYLRKTVGVRAAGRRGLGAVYDWAHFGFNDECGMQNAERRMKK